MNRMMQHRVTARMFGVASLLLVASALADESPFVVSPAKTHTERIQNRVHAYTITVGGTADMDNTATRICSTWQIAFQNNIALTIANTGNIPVENPRVIANGKRRWYSDEAILEEFTRGAKNDQERIYLIYEGMRQNRHHDTPLYADDEYHDPVRFLNIYGGGFCDDSGKCGSALFYLAGFNEERGGKDPFVRALHGHMMCEVWYDADYQWIDIDEDTFFLDRENRKPVSGDTAVRDHDYAKREHVYGPVFQGWQSSPHSNASLFGVDDGRTHHGVVGYEMNYTLRPGERYVFRWDNIGKYPWAREDVEHRYYGNSRIVYVPRLGASAPEFAPQERQGFEPGGEVLVASTDEPVLTIATKTAYTICGGTVHLAWESLPRDGAVALELAAGDESFQECWRSAETGGSDVAIPIDEALGVKGNPPRRSYRLRLVGHRAKGLRLSALMLETDIYAYPIALPRLSLGANQVEYTDDTEAPREITVTHTWCESGNVVPPRPPEAPLCPAPGETVSATYVAFEWPAVEGCDGYALRVSRDPGLRYPYRPNYDLIVPGNTHCVPIRGMFTPGETYYWHVRPRLAGGLWGGSSPVWTFQWQGPMVPRDVQVREEGENFVLTWSSNPNGTRPVRYAVYGSDERGFSVNAEPHDLPVRGKVPGNFFEHTDGTSLVVCGPDLGAPPRVLCAPNANKAFYRVVAIDSEGIESCPSDYAELPRPYVYTRPVTEVDVGDPYLYQMQTFRTIGDLQHRYIEPGNAYWEREEYRFELVKGPAWLRLDAAAGLLTGAPTASDLGTADVEVRVHTEYPHEVPPDTKNGDTFQKTGPKFHRETTHSFTLTVR